MKRRTFLGAVVGLLAAPLGFPKPARTQPENRYVLGCDISTSGELVTHTFTYNPQVQNESEKIIKAIRDRQKKTQSDLANRLESTMWVDLKRPSPCGIDWWQVR